jgi:hypothetical protein
MKMIRRQHEIVVHDQGNRSLSKLSMSENSDVDLFQKADVDDGEVLPSVEDRKAEVNLFSELNRTGKGIGPLNSTLIMKS